MKKILILSSMIVMILTACSSNSSEESVEAEQLTGNQILYRSSWHPNASDDSSFMEYTREYTGEDYHIEMLPLDNALDKLMLDLASEVPMNLVYVSDNDFGTILSKDLALDLRPYLEKYGQNLLDKISDEAWATVTDSETGAIYGIPNYSYQDNITGVTLYRKDILEKEGLEVPKTSDDVVSTVCTLADRGYETPWAINWESAMYEYAMRQAFGVGYVWNETDSNDLEYIGEDSRYLDYLKWANSLYECGGFGVDYETITQDDRDKRFINGDAVFESAPGIGEAEAEGLEALGIDWKDAIGLTADISGPGGYQAATQEGGGDWNVLFIPRYMEPYAKQTIEFANKTYEDEYLLTTLFGEEGTSFEYADDGTPYRIPGTEIPGDDGANYAYYGIGTPDIIMKKSDEMYQQMVADSIEDGQEVSVTDYSTYLKNQYKDLGKLDPLAPALTLELWGSEADCANNKVLEFTDLFVTGRKTEEDFNSLGDDLNNTCNMENVMSEVNDWYHSYY